MSLVIPQMLKQFERARCFGRREMAFNDHVEHVEREGSSCFAAFSVESVGAHNFIDAFGRELTPGHDRILSCKRSASNVSRTRYATGLANSVA
jgi:hypothetical protein